MWWITFLFTLLFTSYAWGQSIDSTHENRHNPLLNGATCTGTTLNAAISFIGPQDKVLRVTRTDRAKAPCTWVLDNDVTVPRNITLYVPHGSRIDTNGRSLTLNGPYIIEDSEWVFGTGSVAYNFPQMKLTESFVISGCNPTVPSPASTTLDGIECKGFISEGLSSWPTVQTLASPGVLVGGDGTYWLGFSRLICDTNTPAGWTCAPGTHYIWIKDSAKPTTPLGVIVYAEVEIVTNITEVRLYPVLSAIQGERGGVIMASDFGFLPSASPTANSLALQFAAFAQQRLTVVGQNPPGAFTGAIPTLVIPAGEYNIDKCIIFASYARIIAAGRAIINQTNNQECHFNWPIGYMVYIEAITFEGGSRAIIFQNLNIDTTLFTCHECEAQDVDDFVFHFLGMLGVQSPTASTTLVGSASGGQTTITVQSAGGFLDNDPLVIINDQGHYHWSSIDGPPAGNVITLEYPIPGYWTGAFASSAGNAVKKGDFHMSCLARFENNKLIGNRRMLFNTCDKVNITDSWLHFDSNRLDANMAQIVSSTGVIKFNNMFGVPQRGSVTGVRWVDIHKFAALESYGSRFGGEDGGVPIVWNYAPPDATYPFVRSGGSVIIVGGDLNAGGIGLPEGSRGVVYNRKHAIQHLVIHGAKSLLTDVDGAIIVDNSSIDWTAYEAGLNANTPFIVDVIGNLGISQPYYGGQLPDRYLKYVGPRRSPFILGSLLTQPPPVPTTLPAKTSHMYVNDIFPGFPGTAGFTLVDEQSQRYVFGAKGIGPYYPQTSVDGTKSIVDTGLTLDVETEAAQYWLMVKGNPNLDGAGTYRDVIFGIVTVLTGFNAIAVSEISFTVLADPATPGIGELTVAAVFWDGVAEVTQTPPNNPNAQIRITVDGYSNNTGDNQRVRLQRIQ